MHSQPDHVDIYIYMYTSSPAILAQEFGVLQLCSYDQLIVQVPTATALLTFAGEACHQSALPSSSLAVCSLLTLSITNLVRLSLDLESVYRCCPTTAADDRSQNHYGQDHAACRPAAHCRT